MGEIHQPRPAVLLLAAFSQHRDALDWARDKAVAEWGELLRESPRFEFVETDYYEPTMGPGLLKTFYAFAQPINPGDLPQVKRTTNAWEAEYAAAHRGDESRPLNLDPGYLTSGKLVLASTKDHAHRIYMAEGIYAEVTLQYQHREWRAFDWTFPDYRRDDYHEFFSEVRGELRCREREGGPT